MLKSVKTSKIVSSISENPNVAIETASKEVEFTFSAKEVQLIVADHVRAVGGIPDSELRESTIDISATCEMTIKVTAN